jgi:succinoglycan biosynthesis transport protein ExoP
MALLRQRVLLIDLDFKHLSILRQPGGDAQQGVSDLLLHDRPPTEVIQPVPELGVDYLPMNRCSVDPVMPIAGAVMLRLLHKLRESYDCVIINSPPVLGSTETRLLAPLADEILFVVKWGSTRRELAQNALNLLRSPGRSLAHQLRSVSALITQVDLKKHTRYGYADVGEYFLNYEKYSSRNRGARTAIAFAGSRHRKTASTSPGLKTRIANWTSRFLKVIPGSWN